MYKLFKGLCYYLIANGHFLAYNARDGEWVNVERVEGWRNWMASEILVGVKEVSELELLVTTGTSKADLTNMTARLRKEDILDG